MRRDLGVVEIRAETPDFLVAVETVEDEKSILIFKVCMGPYVVLRGASTSLCGRRDNTHGRESPQHVAGVEARRDYAAFLMRREKQSTLFVYLEAMNVMTLHTICSNPFPNLDLRACTCPILVQQETSTT